MARTLCQVTRKEVIDALLEEIRDTETKPMVDFVTKAINRLGNEELTVLFDACAKAGDWSVEDLFDTDAPDSVIILGDKKK